jgi:trans-2-enoyl-CoA reductase
MRIRRLEFSSFGDPVEVLRLLEASLPDPEPHEVRVRMEFAPVHPADLNLIEGTYGIKPPLPAVPGNEGVGVVETLGGAVDSLKVSDRVVVPGVGTWSSHLNIAADRCIPLPPAVPAEFASMLYVNPPTAWGLLHEVIDLPTGSWVIQNAATSAAARCVIQIARARGWKTLNLVRRAESIDELRALGGDHVELDDSGLPKRLASLGLGDDVPRRLGLNAVGGESAVTVTRCLTPGGHLVTYGAMSRQPLKFSNGLFIFKNITAHGFWMTQLYKRLDPAARQRMFNELISLHLQGLLNIPVEQSFPLGDWRDAVARANEGGRRGKILLSLGH